MPNLQVKRLLVRDNDGKPLQTHQRLLAGSSAGVMAQITIYPMEVGLALAVSVYFSGGMQSSLCGVHVKRLVMSAQYQPRGWFCPEYL